MKRRYKSSKSKHATIILIAGVMAITTLGVGYAQWDDQINIYTTISTGKLEVTTLEQQNNMWDSAITTVLKNNSTMAIQMNTLDTVEVMMKFGDHKYRVESDLGQWEQQILDLGEELEFNIHKSEIIKTYIYAVQQAIKNDPLILFDSERLKQFLEQHSALELEATILFNQKGLETSGWSDTIEWNVPIQIYNFGFGSVGASGIWYSGIETQSPIGIDFMSYESDIIEAAYEVGLDAGILNVLLGLELEVPVAGGDLEQVPAVDGGELPPMIVVPEDPEQPSEVPSGEIEQPSEVPEVPSGEVEQPSEVPEVPSGEVEQPSEVPEVPSGEVEQPSEVPEVPNEGVQEPSSGQQE
ncbi:MAG: hypothetical protein ACRCTE_04530 [Cellulosilyticaceae bacterium]